MTYLGLYALQHRGQESAGIAASDGQDVACLERDGLRRRHLRQRRRCRACPGHMAIGHVRYSTAARASCRTRSRFSSTARTGRSASATTATWSTQASCATISSSRARSSSPAATPKSCCTCTPARRRRRVEDALVESMSQIQGAFSFVLMTRDRLIARPRSARVPSAGPRPAGRRVRGLFRDVRDGSHRRHLRPRRRAG